MLTYAMDARGEMSLYEYLYRCIRDDIETGAVAAGERLPSKRKLAQHLGVSLITVESAYTQLIAEGYLRSVPRRGYYACELGSVQASASRPSSGPRSRSRAARSDAGPVPAGLPASRPGDGSSVRPEAAGPRAEAGGPSAVADLTGSSLPEGLFPYGAWAKSVREALSFESERELVGECHPAGSPRLRRTIAAYLRGFRGMDVDPECIVVGAGAQLLYNLIVQLLGRGLCYGVEDPGYPRLGSIYRANDVELAYLPLDADGPSMDALRTGRAQVLHLMPSHQFPTGIVYPVSRRYELLGWACESPERYLIEDDYDSEFRLTGRPIPSLSSIDAEGRVIYANTFTKSLGPAFRIGYMVLPPDLALRFRRDLGFYSCTVSAIDQLALARFIEGGGYERHVNRMRTHYRAVRNELLAALRGCAVADRLSVEARDSGIHFVLRVETGGAGSAWDDELCRQARARGVSIRALSGYYGTTEVPEAARGRFLVAYGGLDSGAIAETVPVLEQSIEAADRAAGGGRAG